MKSWGDCFSDHFEKFLGPISRRSVFEIDNSQPNIQILEYDDAVEGCLVFCSFGLSIYTYHIGGVFYEVFLPVDEGWEYIPKILSGTLFTIVEHKIQFGPGFYLGGLEIIDAEFVEKFGKSALYFTPPYSVPDEFKRVPCNNSLGSVIMGMFISTAENMYLRDEGSDHFETLLEKAEIDPYQLSRKSIL